MRKIEQQMCAAVQSNKDWQSANTSVHFDPETGISIVRLHGNKIAEVSDNDMTIFDGGWQSTPQNLALMHFAPNFVFLAKVFSKRILPGMFVSSSVQSTDKMFIRPKTLFPVMYLPEG